MFRRKRKVKFIEINLIPKRQKKFLFSLSTSGIKKEQAFLYLLSLLSFISIFVIKTVLQQVLESKQNKVLQLNKKIVKSNIEIRNLEKQIVRMEEKFKTFYIPDLKEKLFAILYHKWYEQKVIPTLQKFQKEVENFLPYLGYAIYPSPLVDNGKIITSQNIPTGILMEKSIEKNPFFSPQSLPYTELPTYFLKVQFPPIKEDKFLKLINNLHSTQIKDNLLLEYLLLKTSISKIRYSTINLVLIPINIAAPDDINSTRILQVLKENCNVFVINKDVNEKLFYKNSWHSRIVLEGVCIKYIY